MKTVDLENFKWVNIQMSKKKNLVKSFAGSHVLGAQLREHHAFQQDFLDWSASFDENGKRLEQDVESCTESCNPESDEDQDDEPQDGEQDIAAVAASACHFVEC